jgi:hypothetical protein
MYAIAGAILILAVCVLDAGVLIAGDDTPTIYLTSRILTCVGAGMMASDIQPRFRDFVKKAKAARQAKG